MTGSEGSCVFNFIRNCQTFSQSGCSVLHSQHFIHFLTNIWCVFNFCHSGSYVVFVFVFVLTHCGIQCILNSSVFVPPFIFNSCFPCINCTLSKTDCLYITFIFRCTFHCLCSSHER